VDNSHSGNFVNFACPAGNQYHDLATIFFNTQVQQQLPVLYHAVLASCPVKRQTDASVTHTSAVLCCAG
jgi:hypothetical protein